MKIPILKLKNILLISIQVDLTDEDAMGFQDDVLQKVTQSNADGIIIDITALSVVDSFMARVLNDTANMVKLLGCEVVLCGMQPMVALTLIEMGRELINVDTAINLDYAMVKIQNVLSTKGISSPEKKEAR